MFSHIIFIISKLISPFCDAYVFIKKFCEIILKRLQRRFKAFKVSVEKKERIMEFSLFA